MNSGARGVRLALLSSGVVFIAALAACSVLGIVSQFQQGNPRRAVLLALAGLALLLFSLRLIILNWRGVEQTPSTEPIDQTGNWGVGGPSMREPGSTGVWPQRQGDRRYGESDD